MDFSYLNACGVFLDKIRVLEEVKFLLRKGLFPNAQILINEIANKTLPVGATWYVNIKENKDGFVTIDLDEKMFR